MDETTRNLIRMALEEDHVSEDFTTLWSIPEEMEGQARLLAKQSGVFCTGPLFAAVFQALDPKTEVRLLVEEGAPLQAGDIAAEVVGSARVLLEAERTALNLVSHFSGIATLTSQFVEAVQGTRARICDTRKTTPLWRRWDKYAVVHGGGENHRMDLSDQILLKDNHIRLSPTISAAYLSVKEKNLKSLPIEVEVDTLDQLEELLEVGVERVLLDNMSPETLRKAVAISAGRTVLEASGGVNLDTVGAIAETGVDFISVGALTHSVTGFDFSLEIEMDFDDHLDKPNHRVM
ncbi:MAG: carboxylating nicotinate-nucleotide diphosphorylase [Candidatus Omnitrophica bacterium]|nr:carboxylating nicotinate-nucleotide diphosphorylase [Candidatus Omnitrophota bacterium]